MIRFTLLLAFALLTLPACSEEGAKDVLLIETQQGREHSFHIELAVTHDQMAQGLMNRTELAENAGMLFWFGGEEAERGFWMKNTLIPLDMIFIRADGTIHHIHDSAKPLDETTIYSRGPVAAVLEIGGGQSRALGILPGDTVRHRFFGNALAQ